MLVSVKDVIIVNWTKEKDMRRIMFGMIHGEVKQLFGMETIIIK